MLRALLFIPAHDPDARKWMVALWKYCAAKQYKPEAVVHEWCDVLSMVAQGIAEVVVVARREQVEMNWLEVVSEMPKPGEEDVPPGQRRVRRRR
jgi:hypothetical protein